VRILVADDHEVIRRGVRALLASGKDCEICGEAVDGQDAVEKARQLRPDLIIMDVSMPNLNGLEATRAIRRTLPSTQILILTQHDSQEMMRQALNAGARGFVVKSSVAHDLLNAVEAAKRGESFFDPAVAPKVSASSPAADAKTILEREAALEQALRESEERYRALALATDQYVWRADAAGNNVWTSESAQRLLGWASGEAKGRGWLNFVHPDDRLCVAQRWDESFKTGREYRCEFRMRTRDGSYRFFDARGVPVRNPDGAVREWIGVDVDITERKRAELEVRASVHRRTMALSAARVGGFVWDPQSGASELTAELQEIFGFETGSAMDKSQERWLANVHADDRAMVLERMQESASSGNIDFEYRYQHPRLGPRWLYAKGQIRTDEAANGKSANGKGSEEKKMYGVVMDVTERKKAEAELKLVQEELEARVYQRTAELRAAEAGLRHLSARLMQLQDEERRRISRELHDSSGQALAALSMSLSMIERETDKLSERAVRNLTDANRLVRELSQEVRTMSHLLHPPLLDEAGLESALRWFVEGFAQRSGINVDLDLSPELGRLSKEMEISIFRIVQESLANVHRHSGSKTAQVRVGRDAQKVTLEICDQGRGLPVDGKAERPEPAVPGVGIQGMSERVRQLGGHFDIDSTKGSTIVRVEIPAHTAEAASAGKVAQATM
jgi:PAS domain S-box-containing protein